jgi:hypothetical protein
MPAVARTIHYRDHNQRGEDFLSAPSSTLIGHLMFCPLRFSPKLKDCCISARRETARILEAGS